MEELKLEEGKYYRDSKGKRRGPMQIRVSGCFEESDKTMGLWNRDGSGRLVSEPLVSAWPDPPAGYTCEEFREPRDGEYFLTESYVKKDIVAHQGNGWNVQDYSDGNGLNRYILKKIPAGGAPKNEMPNTASKAAIAAPQEAQPDKSSDEKMRSADLSQSCGLERWLEMEQNSAAVALEIVEKTKVKIHAAQVNKRLSFLNTLRPGTVEARFFMEA